MKNIYKLFEMSSFRFDAGFQALLLHKAEEVQRFLEENCPDFIKVDISPKRQIGEWPPNSPDLNPLDYAIWSILEEKACAKPIRPSNL